MEQGNLTIATVTEIIDYFFETTVVYTDVNATLSNSEDTSGVGWPPGGHGGGGRHRFNLQTWSLEIQILIGCICGIVIFMTIFGNLLVLVAYFTNHNLRTYANYFICGLAMVDLIDGLFVQPLYSAYWILGVWRFSSQLCEAYKYINHITGHTTYLFTLVICIDRYRALTKPFQHLKERTYRHAISLMFLAWIIPILSWFGPLFIWPQFGEIHPVLSLKIFCIPYYSISKVFTLFVTIYVSWIPILMICIMYIKIFIVMKKAVKMRDRSNTLNLNRKLSKRSRADTNSSYDKGTDNVAYVKDNDNGENSSSTMAADDMEPAKVKLGANYNEQNTNNVDSKDIKKYAKTQPNKVLDGLRTATATSVSFGVQNTSTDLHYGIPNQEPGLERRRSSQPSRDKIQRQNISATKVLSMIVGVTLISRVPWSVLAIYNGTCGSICVPKYLYQAILFTSHLTSALNPLCYAVANPQFKNTFVRILCCFRYKSDKRTHLETSSNIY